MNSPDTSDDSTCGNLLLVKLIPRQGRKLQKGGTYELALNQYVCTYYLKGSLFLNEGKLAFWLRLLPVSWEELVSTEMSLTRSLPAT